MGLGGEGIAFAEVFVSRNALASTKEKGFLFVVVVQPDPPAWRRNVTINLFFDIGQQIFKRRYFRVRIPGKGSMSYNFV